MNCTKCGKEIDNDSKFCEGCGEAIVAETPIAPKKKFSKKLIAIIAVVVVAVAVIFVVALASGGEDLGAGSSGGEDSGAGSNSFVIETGEDDEYGGVAFNLTLEEFVAKNNASLGEYDRHISMDDFKKTAHSGFHSYSYDFGYYSGMTYHSLAAVVFTTNDTTGKIQAVKYLWKIDGYNTEEAKTNYYYIRPARIFSFFYDAIEYPTDEDYSSYYDLFMALYEKGEETGVTFEVLDNTVYGFFDAGSEEIMGMQFLAMTSDSELAISMNAN